MLPGTQAERDKREEGEACGPDGSQGKLCDSQILCRKGQRARFPGPFVTSQFQNLR